MTRRKGGPKDSGKGDPGHGTGAHDLIPPRKPAETSNITSLGASPAFELWLARNTRKLVQASATRPSQSLVDLIRNWPADTRKKPT